MGKIALHNFQELKVVFQKKILLSNQQFKAQRLFISCHK